MQTVYKSVHKAIDAWYRAHGRHHLPWRLTDDAYPIWLSEVMLQQTQVKTVLERFYYPFLKKFPTLAALARAERTDVMKAWEGLGYYNRAANLHETAKRSAAGLPRSVEELVALPGIGRNTAHAVAAFAYRQAVPVMEANVKRVLHRVFALESAAPDMLWEKAWALLDRKNPFDYNQAMMDVGATVCTKRVPACGICPLNGICKGRHVPERYPTPVKKKRVPVRRRRIVILQDEKGRCFVQQGTGRFLHGLYALPQAEPGALRIEAEGTSYRLKPAKPLGAIAHVYSHFRLEAEVCVLAIPGSRKNWKSPKQLAALPLSKADHKALALLAQR